MTRLPRRRGWLPVVRFPNDPERTLLAAVVIRAAHDYQHGRPLDRADARAYLYGPNFEADAAALGLNVAYVRQHLDSNAPVRAGAGRKGVS